MKSAFLLSLAAAALAATPAQWRSQSVYFLLTDRFARTDNSTTAECDTSVRQYCGGTWRGIINQVDGIRSFLLDQDLREQLDYIQGMGFTAIWITPVTAQLEQYSPFGQAYHGYWQQDIYALNSNYGTEADLKALADALHDRGMYLMVDVVANHMGYNGAPDSVDYSVFSPFNSQKYFHSPCFIQNYEDQAQVEACWLGDNSVPLPDLDTTQTDVQDYWYDWIESLVLNYTSKTPSSSSILQAHIEQSTASALIPQSTSRRNSGTASTTQLASTALAKSSMATQNTPARTKITSTACSTTRSTTRF
ncbi:Putative Alpha-amylase [Aspergillus calidoustus]|uniref:Putative Alpha-amylase n=1 Tax=Aspergillus calidoustus TaxID=454130 RepID=A0A0U5G178_ASPCI|nr:Putative Alpha-amylase [Aspergillus calidoustus]